MADPVISPIPNGPLKVSNAPILRDDRDFEIETGETAFLCRCGLSKKKPFCDGSHKAAGFKSTNDDNNQRDRLMSYTGAVEGVEVTVTYNPKLCSHAAECGRLHKSVFNPAQKPWIQPQKGTLAGIRAVIYGCPSGALGMAEGAAAPSALGPDAETVEIKVAKNGPYEVRNVAVEAEPSGEGASTAKYVLCRCGQSQNKPFCDGSHRDAKWDDEA